MNFFTNKDFKIAYERFDGRGDHNVLFIHGNLASKEWWHPTLEVMGTSGAGTLLTVDWRGYGASKGIQNTNEINMFQCAEDMVSLLENANLQNVHLVGHSTGGLIAMLVAIQKPELVSSLVLLDSVGGEGLILELPEEQVLAHFQKMSEDKDYCRMVLAATIKNADPASSSFENLLNITWQCDRPMWKGVIQHLTHDIDVREQMKSIHQPTLILHGQEDVVLPIKMSESIHELVPNSRLKIIPNHGHSMNMEDPQSFLNECESFWQSL